MLDPSKYLTLKEKMHPNSHCSSEGRSRLGKKSIPCPNAMPFILDDDQTGATIHDQTGATIHDQQSR